MSDGITSGVNWTRLYRRLRAREKARAMVVLPTPGMSSSRMWPPARMASSTFASTSSLPTTARRTSPRMAAASLLPSMETPSLSSVLPSILAEL
ncbi:Uncharacterised protein [Flavonifractor plautii]|uniref:Uncharacterized protein n=1 Tax=Flavonifractor plautii TaxID=292800 RepID=A0A174PTZ5_FLAPL|nr:Uncharacterised protein [Flavonifractor plautii]